jgi:D-glycero-D-manno-heptose 1,7-bisphosphate phosphatase
LGIRIALATNQGGVAFGYMQEADMEHELQRMCEEGNIDDYRVCYNHPKATIPEYCKDDDNRKPGGGMIRDLLSCAKYVGFEDTLYIGDRPEDEEAAKNAGVSFMWAKDFFGD